MTLKTAKSLIKLIEEKILLLKLPLRVFNFVCWSLKDHVFFKDTSGKDIYSDYDIYDKFFLNKTSVFRLDNLKIKKRKNLNTIKEILNIKKKIMNNKKFSQLVEI